MQRLLKAPLIMLLAAFIGCNDDEPTNAVPDPDGVIPTTMVSQIDTADWRIDPFALLEAAIDGDTLRLQVGYGGGCRDHEFQLVISGAFMESEPVQTMALLTHDDDDDPCDAFILTWLLADLTPLKTEWQSAYQRQSGTIVLHLDVPSSQAECDESRLGQPGRCTLFYEF
jgi:hypothetical protein